MNQEDRRMWLQFRHRYYTLSIMEYGLIFIQAIGYIICFMYVTFTFFEYQLPDIPLSTKAYRLSIKVDYMNVLCLILSIFLAFPRPKRLKQRFKLKLALIFLKDNDKDKVSYKKDIINEAKEFITEVDKYYQKKKEPTSEDKIVPHEKRMVLRKRMIEIGIPGVSILTAFLIFYFGWNVPQVASIDLFIGYVLVIFEAWYYQSLLKKEDVKMFSENQKIMIDEGVIKLSSKKLGTKKSKKKIVKKKKLYKRYKKQQFECYQKIFYMKMDRKSNYCMVFGVASSVMNVLSIVITILDSTQSLDFKRLFALEVRSVNNKISLLFAVLAIVFFIVDIIFQHIHESDIYKLSAQINMEYSKENLDALEEEIGKMIDKSILSREALDVGRGVYDFNNDQLIRKCINKETDIYIPVNCMFTVEKAFSGRIPRYKLTVLIGWLISGCIFVWGKAKLRKLVPISMCAIIIYDFILLVEAVGLWVKQRNWIAYEKEMETHSNWMLFRNVNQDFIKRYLLHSCIIMLLACIFIAERNNSISFGTLLLFIGLAGFIGILGCYIKVCDKNFVFSNKIRLLCPILVWIMGILQNIAQYITMGRLSRLPHILISIFVIPLLIGVSIRYYERICMNRNSFKPLIHINSIMLLTNWICIFLVLYWYWHPKNEFSEIALISNILFDTFSLVALCVIAISIMYTWQKCAHNNDENIKVSIEFPYSIFTTLQMFLIIWGMMVFIYQDAVIECSYYITCVLFVLVLLVSTWWFKNKLYFQETKLHRIILSGMAVNILLYMIAVAFKCYMIG